MSPYISNYIHFGLTLLSWAIVLYWSLLLLIYLIRSINALAINLKIKRNKPQRDQAIEQMANSSFAMGVSIIAPAFNESASIVENIRSLLLLRYPQFELIIVNDGSNDNSLEKIIGAYDLIPQAISKPGELNCAEINETYKSSNPAYHNLVVIDKVNGGKADAINAGTNYARFPLIACTDVDCIFQKDALLKLAQPFINNPNVIATGSTIRIINSCQIRYGKLNEIKLPKNLLAKFQVLEYLRAFLIGRISMSSVNSLPLVSGAAGLFKKDLVFKVGGMDASMIGEDMELAMHMRRYCFENGIRHAIEYVPDPLCWTEAPQDITSLSRQRNRWMRGSIEAIIKHRKMILNPKYGVLGLYTLPYWIIYEIFLPIMFILGIFILTGSIISGAFDGSYLLILMGASLSYSIFISSISILIEELTYRQYGKIKDLISLFLLTIAEALVYQPMAIYWSLTGLFDKLFNRTKGWGQMKRVGFSKAQTQ